jgi:hypothetical protein
METILQLQLIDSSYGTICFGDIIPIKYQTPEELFKSLFWRDFRPIFQKEVEKVVSPELITYININLIQDRQYYYSIHQFSGLELYNKILEFYDHGVRVLTSTKKWMSEFEITDDVVYSLTNNETIDGSNQWEEIFDEIDKNELMVERECFFSMIERNKAVERKIIKVSKEIIDLTDEDTFNYIMGLTISENRSLLEYCLSNDIRLELMSQLVTSYV